MLVEEINGCHLVKPVKFPVNSSHWQFLITEFQKYYGNGEKIPPKTSLPLQVSCATEMDWKFGIPEGWIWDQRTEGFLCLLVGVLSPGWFTYRKMMGGKESFSNVKTLWDFLG